MSITEPSPSVTLIQIEEPLPRESDAPGLAIGIELTGETLRIAISVGGNAEHVCSETGGDFCPAWVRRDGEFLEPADRSDEDAFCIGLNALVMNEGTAETLELAAGLQTLLVEARRMLTVRTQRLVTAALMAVPPDLDQRVMALLVGAVEGAGFESLGLIEYPVAVAHAMGLDRRADGYFRILSMLGEHIVSVHQGMIRLVLEPTTEKTPLIDARSAPFSAVLGAALVAEARSGD